VEVKWYFRLKLRSQGKMMVFKETMPFELLVSNGEPGEGKSK
jgi:hypothetical protein